MAVSETAKIFFQGFENAGDFDAAKSKTSTKVKTKKSTADKSADGENKALITLGELLQRQVPRMPAVAPKTLGTAPIAAPIIAPQPQPDGSALAILSQLIGGQ